MMAENVEEMQDNLKQGFEEASIETEEAKESLKETDPPVPEAEQPEENEVARLKKENEELNQRMLRVAADFDNFRKRTRTEKEELAKYANSNLISGLLPVLDNFQLALDVKEPTEEVKKFMTGMEMIYRQLLQALEQAGLEAINAVGEDFDPQKHEAVMQVEDDQVPDNSIVEELRRGYMFKDKVIRPSMVKVAKNQSK
jgi:molecular chaperone GrpE